MGLKDAKPEPGDMVLVKEIPPGLLNGLPLEDQQAIIAAVGGPVLFTEYDDWGRAELEFTDKEGTIHYIYVDIDVITPLE